MVIIGENTIVIVKNAIITMQTKCPEKLTILFIIKYTDSSRIFKYWTIKTISRPT
jgi:hypothetical protein